MTKSEAPASPLFQRLLLFASVLAAEVLGASLLFDSEELFHALGPAASTLLGKTTIWTTHFLIGFGAIFCTFFYLQYRAVLVKLVAQAQTVPANAVMIAAHFIALAAFGACSFALSRQHFGSALLLPWLASGISLLLFAALAFLPLRLWLSTIRATGLLPLYSGLGAALAASVVQLSERLWLPLSGLTFALVHLLLSPILPAMVVEPQKFRIGSSRFTAIISPSCSGMEGAALLLIFLAIWLVLFRKEIRFPQALLLIPTGVALLLLLNAARIAALILIGHAGARDIAAKGFHSQAGWIVFNSVALAITVGARRIPWISTARIHAAADPARAAQSTAISAYLTPFLAILLAGMLSRAASGNFEWTYALRLLAAAIPLWLFRRTYAPLLRDWDWRGPAAGVVVFLLWIAVDKLLFPSASALPMPAALRDAAAPWRTAWICLRAITAVAVVPLAEELAFRGFLMRRFAVEDFEHLDPRRTPWLALAASSLIFGLLHGSRWAAGSIAGLVYAVLYRQRANLGTAVSAHAVTNLLLAIYVLQSGNWSFW